MACSLLRYEIVSVTACAPLDVDRHAVVTPLSQQPREPTWHGGVMIKRVVTVASILVGSAALGFVAYVQAHATREPRIKSDVSIPSYTADGTFSETPKGLLGALDAKTQVHIVLVNPVFIVNGPQRTELPNQNAPSPPQTGSALPDVKSWIPAVIVQ